MLSLTVSLLFLTSSGIHCQGTSKHPVILVPGLGASRLWQRKDPETFYRSLWVYPRKTFFSLESLVEDMKLNVNSSTGTTHDDRGQTVKACGFGNPEALTGLVTSWNPLPRPFPKMTSSQCDGDTFYGDVSDFQQMNETLQRMFRMKGASFLNGITHFSLFKFCSSSRRRRKRSIRDCLNKLLRISRTWKNLHYFKDIITALQKKGYRVNVDIKGAPYDFRKAPNELTGYFRSLQRLIETTSARNGNSKVVVVAHSYGNSVLLYFYNSVVTREWKDKFIRAHVALGPPWAGATKTVKLMVSGDNVDLPFVKGRQLRPMQRSWPTVAWLMPSPSHGLWKKGEALVKTDWKSYGVGDYRQLFQDLGYPAGQRMWETVERTAATDLSTPPEVRELHVFYGFNVRTPGQFIYRGKAFPDSEPQVVYEKDGGDGTVNRRSLEAFKRVRASGFRINMTHHGYPGVDHMDVLRDKRVLDFLGRLVLSRDPAFAKESTFSREPAFAKESTFSREPAFAKESTFSRETAASVRKDASTQEASSKNETASSRKAASSGQAATSKEAAFSEEPTFSKEFPFSEEPGVTPRTAGSKSAGTSCPCDHGGWQQMSVVIAMVLGPLSITW